MELGIEPLSLMIILMIIDRVPWMSTGPVAAR